MKAINPAAISAGMLSNKELAQRLQSWAVNAENQRMYPTDKKIIAALLCEAANRIAPKRKSGAHS